MGLRRLPKSGPEADEAMYSTEVQELVYSSLINLFKSQPIRLRASKRRALLIPDFILNILKEKIENQTGRLTGELKFFMGVPIYPHYKLEIILFDKDYPITNSKEMCIKVTF